jgi:hypothetical protein
VRKFLFATSLSFVAPSVAFAQLPPVSNPSVPDAPRMLDPGATERPYTPPPPPSRPAQQPNVIVVGPDGKVNYNPADKKEPATSYYYYSGGGDGASDGFGMGEDQSGPLHTGATPDLHVVRKGDTLWDICYYYFNDPWQWPKVWSYNPQITNPHWIYPGDLVRLLPRGMFSEAPTTAKTEPEADKGAGASPPADNLPAPAQRTNVGLRETTFVEKSELDRAITVDGSVDEKELLALGDAIYLSYPANNPPKVGQRYTIYRPDSSVKSGDKVVGAYVRLLGTVEIVSVKQDKRARGVIVEVNREIERGAKVGPLVKQYKSVPPVPPKVDAQGAIVAMLHAVHLIGRGEVVFVDLGKSSGVEVGNRLFVVRRGDALPPMSSSTVGQDDRRFPARALGEILLVEVGDKVSIGLVTVSVQEMGVGDLVMMQKAP